MTGLESHVVVLGLTVGLFLVGQSLANSFLLKTLRKTVGYCHEQADRIEALERTIDAWRESDMAMRRHAARAVYPEGFAVVTKGENDA